MHYTVHSWILVRRVYDMYALGNALSSFASLERRVRRGEVLSPYLFAIFIGDIIQDTKNTELDSQFQSI